MPGSGLDLRAAPRVALAADTVSIAVLEAGDNAVVVTVPGAMDAGLGTLLFRGALAGSLAPLIIGDQSGRRPGANRSP